MQKLLELLFKNKEKTSAGLTLETPSTIHIPSACHYNDDTLLNKNGELLQIIKITGFSKESIGSEDMNLRAMVRQAINENVKSNNFSLWIHTIRRKKNLKPEGSFDNIFSHDLDENWNRRHQWDSTYVNELYITVLRDGKATPLGDPKGFLASLYFGIFKKIHFSELERNLGELNEVIARMLETLAPFGALKLTVVKKDNVFYSEPLRFFGKIINLSETQTPLPLDDISRYLTNHKIAFGYNSMEVVGPTGKHFGTIVTIKEYHEQSGKALDEFLQIPQEFIVTQTIDFINYKKALKDFQEQSYLLEVSGDNSLAVDSGLQNILESDQGNPTDFGESQMTVFFINDDVNELEEDVNRAFRRFHELGIVAFRHDLRLEQCYWSQLPGNFVYLSHLRPINTSRIGGMASLYNFPAGRMDENKWGPAVVVLKTAKGMPYFFNFHIQDSGHTAIMGPFGVGKTVLTNFFVSQAQKFKGKLFFFDQERASKVFIKALGGHYSVIRPNSQSHDLKLNPLMLSDSKDNRAFLLHWLTILASTPYDIEHADDEVTKEEKEQLIRAVDYVYSLPEDQRTLSNISGQFTDELSHKMAQWHGEGAYAHLFDNPPSQSFKMDDDIYGFGMSHVLQHEKTLAPTLFYLFHRIELALDGRPTLIVLDEAWKLVNNPIFAPGMANWLDRMKAKNAAVFFATENIDDDSKTELTEQIIEKITTQIYLPNYYAEKSTQAYQKIWKLNLEEFKMLQKMTVKNRQFLLRQDGNTIVASLSLEGMKELAVLSGGDETVELMNEAINQTSDDPEQWLPVFYEKIDQG